MKPFSPGTLQYIFAVREDVNILLAFPGSCPDDRQTYARIPKFAILVLPSPSALSRLKRLWAEIQNTEAP